MKKLLLFCLCFLVYGCGHYEYPSDYTKASVTKNGYTISISNIKHYEYYGKHQYNTKNFYILSINNESKEDIEIDWNRTSFIYNGQTNGTFMFEGVKYIDRNNFKNPTVIMSGTNQTIDIYPNNLVYNYGHGWKHDDIPDGESGVYLVFKHGSKEQKEKLLITRSTIYVNN